MLKQQLSASLFVTAVSLEIGVCVLLLHLAAPLPVDVPLLLKRFFSLIALLFTSLDAHNPFTFWVCIFLSIVISLVVGFFTKLLLDGMHWAANSIAHPHDLVEICRRYAKYNNGDWEHCSDSCFVGAFMGGMAVFVCNLSLSLFLSLMGALLGAAVAIETNPSRTWKLKEDVKESETKIEGFIGF